MNDKLNGISAISIVLALCFCVHADAYGFDWKTGAGFQVQDDGLSLQSDNGANITISSATDPSTPGIAATTLEAAPFQHERITVSGSFELVEGSARGGAAIYIKVYGVGGALGFASSQIGGLAKTGQQRSVTLSIPEKATKIAIGVILVGGGKATVRHLRLTSAKASAATASQMVDSAIGLVRGHALYADRIDWATVEPRMRSNAEGMTDAAQAYPLIAKMITKLQDHHSRLLSIDERMERTNNGRTQGQISATTLGGGLGYINVPGFTGVNKTDVEAFADSLTGAIERLAPDAPNGWVVDLRQDTGGNMNPMLSGLYSFLGPDKLGAFRLKDGTTTFWSSSPSAKAREKTRGYLSNIPVAVLIGPHTSSSGEIIAISFKGRPNTKFFGEPTDGRTTGNSFYPLPDGSGLLIATASESDRTGHRYEDRIAPDVQIISSTDKDEAVLHAGIQWLKKTNELSH